MRLRHVAEPLLWLGGAAGVLWTLVLLDLRGADLQDPDLPIASGLPLTAAVLGPGLCLAAGAALAQLRRTRHARWTALATGGLLTAAGFGFRRIPEIEVEMAGAYFWVPVVAAVVIGLVALAPWPEPDHTRRDPDPASPLALVFLVGLGVAGLTLFEVSSWGWVGVWEEEQPAWDYGMPAVLLGVGMVPAAIHSYRRRWPAVGITVLLTGTAFAAAVWGAIIAI